MTQVWQLVLLWGVVVGIGTGMTALVLGATIATRWFVARRGLVVGILTASVATGQLLFLPLLAAITERLGWRIALAESCTGGLTTSRLTDVSGSSTWVERALVCYSNRAKTELAAVPPALIEAHGAVSEPVARAMAEGARAAAGVEVGVGITGIAGPTGGRDAKPVGTVAIAVVWPGGEVVRTFRFLGDRGQVKWQSSQAALDLIRRAAGAGRAERGGGACGSS
jgi:PncC family amidohydrolase